jgi:hypothetical protein
MFTLEYIAPQPGVMLQISHSKEIKTCTGPYHQACVAVGYTCARFRVRGGMLGCDLPSRYRSRAPLREIFRLKFRGDNVDSLPTGYCGGKRTG